MVWRIPVIHWKLYRRVVSFLSRRFEAIGFAAIRGSPSGSRVTRGLERSERVEDCQG
jgi:hypothetical protein